MHHYIFWHHPGQSAMSKQTIEKSGHFISNHLLKSNTEIKIFSKNKKALFIDIILITKYLFPPRRR